MSSFYKYVIVAQSVTLYALVFFLGNGRIDLLVPGIEISIGGDLARYVTLFVGLAAVTLTMSRERRTLLLTYVRNPLSLMIICLFTASILSYNRLENLRYVSGLLVGYLFCLAVALQLRERRTLDRVVLFFLAGQVLMFFTAMKNTLPSTAIVLGDYDSIFTPMGDNAASALAFGVCPPLLFAVVLRLSSRLRYVLLACFIGVFSISPLFLSPTIIGVSFLGGALCFAIRLCAHNRKVVVWAIVLGLIGSMSLCIAILHASGELTASSAYSFSERVFNTIHHELGLVGAIWSDYPLSGIGGGKSSFDFLLPRYIPFAEIDFLYPLTFYSHWLVSFGFLGLTGIGLVLWFVIRPSWGFDPNHQGHSTRHFFQAALVSFFCGVFAYNPMANDRLLILMWLLCGCFISISFLTDAGKEEFRT